MKLMAFLINVSLGALVDEVVLENAVVEGQIAGAGLDALGQGPPVMSSPNFSHSNLATTPNIAGATDCTSRKREQAAADNIDRIASGLEPRYCVV